MQIDRLVLEQRTITRRGLLRLVGAGALASSATTLLAACGDDADDEPATDGDGGEEPTAETPEDAGAEDTPGSADTEETSETSEMTPTTSDSGTDSGTPAGEAGSGEPGSAVVDLGLIPANVQPGGTLTVAIGTDISSLEPQMSTETSSAGVRTNLYDTLVWVQTPDWEIQPWLASQWEASDDGMTYTFTLVDTPVTFHDGTTFDANAVKATFDRLLEPDRNTAATINFKGYVSGVEVIDPATVQFNMAQVFAPFLVRMGQSAASMMSPAAIEKYGEEYDTNPIGTGPYKFVEYRKGDHVTFEKHADYWNGLVPYDQVIYKIVPEDASRAVLVQTGEAQVADRLPPVLAIEMQDKENVKVGEDLTSRFVFFVLNQNRDVMKTIEARRAVNYGVDKQSIVDNIMRGFGEVPDSPMPSVAQFYSPQEPYAYDVEQAKGLLQEAGIEPGTPLVIWTPQGRYVGDKDIATAVQGMMQELGFEPTVQAFGDFPAYIEQLDSLEFDMAIWGWVSPDPDVGLNQIYSSDFVGVFPNWGSYSNPEVDELLNSANSTLDDDERADLYAQAQKLIWDDAAVLWTDWQYNLTGLGANVEGVFVTLGEVLVVRFSGYTS